MHVLLPQWLRELRASAVISQVMDDPRSTSGRVLGVSVDNAKQAVEWGQADFDKSWRNLTCEDLVLLYAYFFQLGHLEELIAAFRQLFNSEARPEKPIIVDMGCGPFTGGLAIGSELGGSERFDYIGVDQSSTMCEFGERLAEAAECYCEMPQVTRHWATNIPSIQWQEPPSWRPVIVIMSYVLASPTLDAERFVAELNRLLCRLGRGHVTVFYTNSPKPGPNRSFKRLTTALGAAGFDLSTENVGTIEIERQGDVRRRRLRYALFSRQERVKLNLGGVQREAS